MSTWKRSQHTMQNSYLASEKALTFAYRVDNGIYLNITNRCTNSCEFCLRNNGSTAYGSDPLWLEREPSAKEVVDAVKDIIFDDCKEFVFCGYGEPTCRFDVLVAVAGELKKLYNIPIRLNTNGQANMITGKNVVPALKGLVDTVSVSLNAPDRSGYDALCHSVFGENAFDGMLDFVKQCKGVVPQVFFSVVKETLSEPELQKCAEIAANCGAMLKIRSYISDNNQIPPAN